MILEPTTGSLPEIYEVGNGGGIDSIDPCSSHTVINDPTRNFNYTQAAGVCDDSPLFITSIGGRWIRFLGSGGTLLSSIILQHNRCGAYLPIWSNMTLPTIVNTITNGSACFHGYSIRCFGDFDISVIKCTDFYAYFLPPVTLCKSRYCTV